VWRRARTPLLVVRSAARLHLAVNKISNIYRGLIGVNVSPFTAISEWSVDNRDDE
jgi:hypothetical protein